MTTHATVDEMRRGYSATRARLWGAADSAFEATASLPLPIERKSIPACVVTVAQLGPGASPKGLTPRERARLICKRVARDDGLAYDDIMGPRQHARVVAARHLAIWLVHKANPMWSFPQIGRFFAGRDHTTIMHAITKTTAQFSGRAFNRRRICVLKRACEAAE